MHWYPTINHNEMNRHGDSIALWRIKNADNQRKRRQDLARREEEQVANTAQWRTRRREQPWVLEHEALQRATAREEPGRRDEENEQWRTRREQPGVLEHEALQRATAREEPGRRDEENEQRRTRREQPGVLEDEAIQRSTAREEPGRREEEQEADTAQRCIAREQPGVREHEARQLRMARANKHVHMATKFVNGEHVFHQHFGTCSEECVHGCGYIHLSSSTAGTRKKCCANGRLSLASDSDNFDEELMNEHELDPMPSFLMRIISTCTDISRKLSIYNILVAMAGTAVCNYSELNGWL